MPPDTPSTPAPSFAVAVSCIDGRTHEPLVAWARRRFGVDHVDLVTQPGADRTLNSCPEQICDDIRDRIQVSITAHRSTNIIITGHDDCAANPTSPDEHRQHITQAIAEIETWNLGPVVGAWIDHDGNVTEITRTTEQPARNPRPS